MHRHARGILPVVAASALAVALTTGAGAAPAAAGGGAVVPGSPAAGPGPAPAGGSHTVTLITGDHVRVTDLAGKRKAVAVLPGAGRQRIAFMRQVVKDQLTVLPSDAAPLVASGRLDARLFNVTALIKQRYDDAATSVLPLIVSYPGSTSAARTAATQTVTASRGDVVRALPSVNGLAVRQPKADAGRFWQNVRQPAGAGARTLTTSVGKIWLDGQVKASLNQSVPQIGAPQAWAAGYTGKGVKVAILDTGIDQKHPDVAPLIAASRDFSGSASGVQDKFGHGTHVASIVAGSGAASQGKYKGVAPDARLVVGKVLDDDGFGEESWITAGMEWAAGQGAKVANLSLGGGDTPELDPLEAAVNRLTLTWGAGHQDRHLPQRERRSGHPHGEAHGHRA
jgi:subtilisin family serine protease